MPSVPKTAEIPAKRIQNVLKNAHRGNHKLKNFSGEVPPYERGMPPLVLSPTHAFGTRSNFRRTTFKYVATGLIVKSRNSKLTLHLVQPHVKQKVKSRFFFTSPLTPAGWGYNKKDKFAAETSSWEESQHFRGGDFTGKIDLLRLPVFELAGEIKT